MIFETRDLIWKVALVGVKDGVGNDRAAKELLRLGENVMDEFTARRFLKDLPKPVHVKSGNMVEFKGTFEIEQFFHHQRFLFDDRGPFGSREVWVTLRDPEAIPDPYFIIVEGLLSDPSWDKIFRGSIITLKDGVVIMIDRSP